GGRGRVVAVGRDDLRGRGLGREERVGAPLDRVGGVGDRAAADRDRLQGAARGRGGQHQGQVLAAGRRAEGEGQRGAVPAHVAEGSAVPRLGEVEHHLGGPERYAVVARVAPHLVRPRAHDRVAVVEERLVHVVDERAVVAVRERGLDLALDGLVRLGQRYVVVDEPLV